MIGFWGQSPARFVHSHFLSSPYFVAGIIPVSFVHYRPHSLWMLANIFADITWTVICLHFMTLVATLSRVRFYYQSLKQVLQKWFT